MKFEKKMFAALAVVAMLFTANAAMAASNPIDKLGRGIANVAFGPLEMLIRPYDVNQDQGAIASLTSGVLYGVGYTILRELVGVTDIVTFLVPLPGCSDDPLSSGYGYGPIMTPEWVVDPDHNAFNFFYNEQAIIESR